MNMLVPVNEQKYFDYIVDDLKIFGEDGKKLKCRCMKDEFGEKKMVLMIADPSYIPSRSKMQALIWSVVHQYGGKVFVSTHVKNELRTLPYHSKKERRKANKIIRKEEAIYSEKYKINALTFATVDEQFDYIVDNLKIFGKDGKLKCLCMKGECGEKKMVLMITNPSYIPPRSKMQGLISQVVKWYGGKVFVSTTVKTEVLTLPYHSKKERRNANKIIRKEEERRILKLNRA